MRFTSIHASRVAFATADTTTGPVTDKPAIAVKPRKAAKPNKPATKAAKPATGKPAKRATSATTTPDTDKRAERAQRIAADRSTVAAFYAAFEAGRASVPVKPVAGFKLHATTAHPIARHPSPRQAAAICAALAAAGVKLGENATAPRCFVSDGVNSAIENGVLRDAVSSGLIRVSGTSPEAEKLSVTKSGAAYIRANIGEKALKAAKLA